MADIGSNSWICVTEGNTVPVFDDVFSVMMTSSPQEVLQYGERFASPRNPSLRNTTDNTDGILRSRSPSKGTVSTTGSDVPEAALRTVEVTGSGSGCLRSFGDGGYMFRLESAFNPVNREDVYHVIKDVRIVATKAMRINDRLVSVNDKDVRNKSLEDVEQMWEQLQDDLKIQLRVWRWSFDKNGPQINAIKIVFYSKKFNTDPELSSLTLNRKTQRVVSNLRWTSTKFIPYRLRIVFKSGTFVSAHVEDLTLYGEAIATDPHKNTFRFLIRFFRCMVQTEDGKTNIRYGFVGKYKEDGKFFDMSSNFAESTSNVVLKPHVMFNRGGPDERFFLMFENKGSGDDVFESLLYEKMFMKFNYDSTRITMEGQENPGPSSKFQKFRTRGNGSPTISLNSFSDGECIFSFERIEEEDDDDDDDDDDEEEEE